MVLLFCSLFKFMLVLAEVNAKNDLSDTQDALAEDSNFLIELKTTCSEQVKLYDQARTIRHSAAQLPAGRVGEARVRAPPCLEVKKMRAEEISAVGATIKIRARAAPHVSSCRTIAFMPSRT